MDDIVAEDEIVKKQGTFARWVVVVDATTPSTATIAVRRVSLSIPKASCRIVFIRRNGPVFVLIGVIAGMYFSTLFSLRTRTKSAILHPIHGKFSIFHSSHHLAMLEHKCSGDMGIKGGVYNAACIQITTILGRANEVQEQGVGSECRIRKNQG
jgi:hypothetical protein